MKITIPRIVRDVPLKDYAPEMNGAVIKVWVNPTRDFTRKIFERETVEPSDKPADRWKSGIDPQTAEWFAELFSQDPAIETHLTADDLQQLFETDPSLWGWLQNQAWSLLSDHIAGLEKKPERP